MDGAGTSGPLERSNKSSTDESPLPERPIAYWRRRTRDSQKEAAKAVGVSTSTWKRWEHGEHDLAEADIDAIDAWLHRKLPDEYERGTLRRQLQRLQELGRDAAEEAPSADEGTKRGKSEIEAKPTRRRSRRRVIAGAIVLVALAGTVAIGAGELLSSGEAPKCSASIGEVDASLAKKPSAEAISSALRDAARSLPNPCASAVAAAWGDLATQDVSVNGRPAGTLVATLDGAHGVLLNRAQFGSYHQLGLNQDTSAQTVAGLPISIRTDPTDNHIEIDLSTGGLLVGEHEDGPYFWIVGQYVTTWRSLPLGLPTSNPVPSLRQDFQHGFGQIVNGSPSVTYVTPAEAQAQLPDNIAGRILHQSDNTSWWIPQAGHRLWIPDGDTYRCLGGDKKLLQPDVPGYAIETLAYDGVATCP